MKNRLGIFSFFDKAGYVDDYVIHLLKELVACTNHLIIVANGLVDERGQMLFAQYTNEVYIRDNVGFDAGAYKYVLCQKLSEEEINSYDEILLCNDTFYGPFIPMKDIFGKMENVDCDIWGLNGYFDWVFEHLQSYFLVFRKRVIEEKLIVNYLNENIDENSSEINHIYCQFENGLFDYLVRKKGMKCAKYLDENKYLDVYKYSYAYLREFQFPIVKKRVFSYMDSAFDNAMCTLSYIKYETTYDIQMILDNICRIYGIRLEIQDIKRIEEYTIPQKSTLHIPVSTVRQIEEFIGDDEFYIYGAGLYACNTYWRYAKDNNKFQGFIISDGQNASKDLFGHPVRFFSEAEDIYTKKVVLSVNAEVADVILSQFTDCSKVLRIF